MSDKVERGPASSDSEGSWLHPMLKAVMPKPEGVREYVDAFRKANPKATRQELVDVVADRIVWQSATQGALLALPGSISGLGTAAQIAVEAGSISTDLALLFRNQSYMALSIAEVCGHDLESEGRLDDVVTTIALWCGVAAPAGKAATRIATKVGAAQFKRVPGELFKRINRIVGTTIVTKYGTKRGGVALGKLVPFGVGALVGGGFNLVTMRAYKRSVVWYFLEHVDAGEEISLEVA